MTFVFASRFPFRAGRLRRPPVARLCALPLRPPNRVSLRSQRAPRL